jgi:hypothetical protein
VDEMKHVNRFFYGSLGFLIIMVAGLGLAHGLMWFTEWKYSKFVMGVIAGSAFSYFFGWIIEQWRKSRQPPNLSPTIYGKRNNSL